MTRTPGVSNPVNVQRAAVDKIADEDHAQAGAHYLEVLERRAAAATFVQKVKRRLGLS